MINVLERLYFRFSKQNRESNEGYSKSIVRKKITTSSEKDWSQQVEHMQFPKGRDQVSEGVRVPVGMQHPLQMIYGNQYFVKCQV